MVIDKALLLKGLAGVAALGGTIGGGIVYKSLSSSKKEAKDKGEENTRNDEQAGGVNSITNPPAANTASTQSTLPTDNQRVNGLSGPQTPTVTEGQNAASGGVQPGAAGAEAPGSVVPSSPSANQQPQESDEQKKKTAKKEEVNGKLKTLGIEGCDLVDDDLTSPTAYSKECALDQTKFKKINFSNKGSSGEVTVTGWTNGNTVTLKIENKNTNGTKFSFKDVKDNLTIVGESGKGVITLSKDSEKEFEEKENKLSKVSGNSSETTKKKKINEKLKTLKFPDRCWFDEAEKDDFTECSLSNLEELKKIEFKNKEESRDLSITGGYTSLKVKIRRLKKSSDDEKEYNNTIKDDDLRFTFKDISSKITINDGEPKNKNSDVIMPKGSDMEFLVYSTGSTKLGPAYNPGDLGSKVGMSCGGISTSNGKAECTSLENKKIKIYNSASKTINELTVGKDKKIFYASDNQDNYNQGFKFTVHEAVAGNSGGPSLTKGDNYEIKYVDKSDGSKGWALVKKTN